jgi:hypothetical protein
MTAFNRRTQRQIFEQEVAEVAEGLLLCHALLLRRAKSVAGSSGIGVINRVYLCDLRDLLCKNLSLRPLVAVV